MTKPEEIGRWLETLVDRAAEGFLLVAEDGQVEYANAAALAILGTEADVIAGTSVDRWIPDCDPSRRGPFSDVEAEAVSAKDDRFPVEYSGTPVDEESGRAWVVFRDISRRKGLEGSIRLHAEELEKLVENRTRELEELRARYGGLYDAAPVLDFELDSEGAIASANRKSCLSLGVAFDRLVGLPLVDLVAPDHRRDLEVALERLRSGSYAPFETRLRGADGSAIEVVFHPVRAGPTSRSAMRIVGLDVTARREAERLVDQSLELAEAQRARMERMLRGIGEGLVVTDPDGQVRLMNAIAERFLEVDERIAFGRDLFSEQRDLEFVQKWRTFASGEDDTDTAELRRGGLEPRTFSVTLSRIRTPEGRPAGCVAVMRDVTAERLRDRMRRDFISNVTHELRTPLASIRRFTEAILVEEPSLEESHRYLAIVEKEARRLQQLIEDMYTLSSLEAGRETLNFRPADLADLLHDAEATFAPVAREKRILLEVQTRGQNGDGVFDPEKMRRVLDSLIGNALKFTAPGGRVSAGMRRQGDRLECTVADTGKGIEPDLLEHIFDRFYSKNPTPGNPWGTGLGLHIVRRLVELHDGEITVESRPGEGTTFRFSILAAPKVEAPEEEPVEDVLLDDPLLDDPEPARPIGLPPANR